MCSQCNMEETLNHVFWECIEYVDQRKILQDALIKTRSFLLYSIKYQETR